MLTVAGQEDESRDGHLTLPCFARYLPLLVQHGQTDHHIWLGGLELERCQDVCAHLNRVTAAKFR